MGACAPRRIAGNFSKYTIFAVLNIYVFYSVEYSACVSGFWGIRPQTLTGVLPWTSVGDVLPPEALFCSSVANS